MRMCGFGILCVRSSQVFRDGFVMVNKAAITILAFRNKLCLELIAKNNGATIATNFELESFKKKLELQNVSYSESQNPGTSYCNLVYWNSLKYIEEKKLDCKFLFVHVPFEKNISNISELREKLNKVIKSL